MKTPGAKNEKYLNLREAAKMSGYSADYVGQLVRSGKLPGRQVFSSVAWMVSEKDLREYMNRGKNEGADGNRDLKDRLRSVRTKIGNELQVAYLYKTVLYAAIALSVAFSLALFYVFSVSIDKAFEKNIVEKRQGTVQ